MAPDDLMQLAIEACQRGLQVGQSPFGCAIHYNGEVVAATHNTVALTTDITAHAEVNALREACRHTGGLHLEGAIVATTCEPCPMCMGALHWGRVGTVYYGASIDDAKDAGFNELQLPATDMVRLGGSTVQLVGGTQAEACRELFQQWLVNPNRRVY